MKRFMNAHAAAAPIIRDQRGFTLLETILALSIVAVIVGVLLMAMRLGISSWEKGEHYVEATGAKRLLVEMLDKDVSSIYPYTVSSDDSMSDEEEYVFIGKPQSVVFVTSSRASITGIPWGGLRWVRYGMGRGGLVIREKTVPTETLLDERGGAIFEMDSGVNAVGFKYFGREGWEESWDMAYKQRLPSAIKVQLFFRDDRAPLVYDHARFLNAADL